MYIKSWNKDHLLQSCFGFQCFCWLSGHRHQCSWCSRSGNSRRWTPGGGCQGEFLRWYTLRRNSTRIGLNRKHTQDFTNKRTLWWIAHVTMLNYQLSIFCLILCLLPCGGKLTAVAWAKSTRYVSLCFTMASAILTCWTRCSRSESSSAWAFSKLCSRSPTL